MCQYERWKEEMNQTTLQWFYESFNEQSSSDKSFDRLEFYKEYFTNLTPDSFDIDIQDGKIVIDIEKKSSSN